MLVDPHPTHTALVIAAASIWRDALVSLMRAQPGWRVSQVLDSAREAQSVLARSAPDVIIIESGNDESTLPDFIAWLHETHVAVRCVVAVDTHPQQSRYLAAGADATLLKGCLDEASLHQAVAG